MERIRHLTTMKRHSCYYFSVLKNLGKLPACVALQRSSLRRGARSAPCNWRHDDSAVSLLSTSVCVQIANSDDGRGHPRRASRGESTDCVQLGRSCPLEAININHQSKVVIVRLVGLCNLGLWGILKSLDLWQDITTLTSWRHLDSTIATVILYEPVPKCRKSSSLWQSNWTGKLCQVGCFLMRKIWLFWDTARRQLLM